MKLMKILFVVNNYYAIGNGLSASARRTVQALRDAGQDVRVISCINQNAPEPQPEFPLQPYHFPIFQPIISAHGYQFSGGDKKVIEQAIRWADVVHMEEPFVLQIKAVKIAERLGKPITGTYHLHPENIFYSIGLGWWHGLNNALLAIWRDWVFNHCSILQCPTENVRQRLQRRHFKSELRTFSNGIIPEECLRPDNPPADYEDPSRPLDVVYIGRLSVEKDQPTLIRAIRHSKYAKRIRLHFAGQGPRTEAYKRRAYQLYEEGTVQYEPIFTFNTREELRDIAAKADLCIHCATVEVEGLSIMEAIQQGAVPIIAEGWHTGTSQFAMDNRSIFPEKDDKALAERIDYWLSHPRERWKAGKKYAESMKKYDISRSAEELVKMFEDAMTAKK